MIEVLKQAYQLLLNEPHAPTVCDQLEVIFRQAIAELESQEPVALHAVAKRRVFDAIRGAYDLGYNDAKAINYKGRDVEKDHGDALIHALERYTTPPQRTEQNFCSRCGKRTNDIHTCTPPQRTEQEPVQVSPLEFVEMVMEKEHLIGKPIFWAEWPNQEKNT
jgi:hypothetical protein